MCFYDCYRWSCGDYKWGNFRQHCNKETRMGETCGMKLVMETLPQQGKCKLCEKVDTKLRKRAVQCERIQRWTSASTDPASIAKSYETIAQLDAELHSINEERQKKMGGTTTSSRSNDHSAYLGYDKYGGSGYHSLESKSTASAVSTPKKSQCSDALGSSSGNAHGDGTEIYSTRSQDFAGEGPPEDRATMSTEQSLGEEQTPRTLKDEARCEELPARIETNDSPKPWSLEERVQQQEMLVSAAAGEHATATKHVNYSPVLESFSMFDNIVQEDLQNAVQQVAIGSNDEDSWEFIHRADGVALEAQEHSMRPPWNLDGGLSDSESIFSYGSTLSSVSSHGSVEAKVALFELVKLLLEHDRTRPLLEEATHQVNAERFEAHVRTLLQNFGDGLEAEAKGEAQIQAAIFVRQSAKTTAALLRSAIVLGEDFLERLEAAAAAGRARLEQLLKSIAGNQPAQPDGEDSDEEDGEHFQSLWLMQEFLTSARAFRIFCEDLKCWLQLEYNATNPPDEPTVEAVEDDTIEEEARSSMSRTSTMPKAPLWSRLWYSLLNIFSPTSSDFQRVTYLCGCGELTHVDVKELAPGGIEQLRQRLAKSSKSGASLAEQQRPNTNYPAAPCRAYIRSDQDTNQPNWVNSQADSDFSNLFGLANPFLSAVSADTPCEEDDGSTRLFLHLCINRRAYPAMEPIEVDPRCGDEQLSKCIRERYDQVRWEHEWRLNSLLPKWLLIIFAYISATLELTPLCTRAQKFFHRLSQIRIHKIKSGDFVRFHLIPVHTQSIPSWFKVGSFPPVEQVTQLKIWDYDPVPMDVEIMNLPLAHLLKPGRHMDNFWSTTVPKKLNEPVIRIPGTKNVIGWGIRINEGLDWVVIMSGLLAVLLAIGIGVGIYAVLTADKSSAFSLGAYLVAVVTVYLTFQYFAWVDS